MLVFLEALYPTAELVCTGEGEPSALQAFLRENVHPELSVLVKTLSNQDALSQLAPFTEAYPIPNHGVQYYLCRDQVCSAPVDDISKLDLSN